VISKEDAQKMLDRLRREETTLKPVVYASGGTRVKPKPTLDQLDRMQR
jgi:hypothetical protein